MPKLFVAGIKLLFEPAFTEYFGAKLKPYESDFEGEPDHIIRSVVAKNIGLPMSPITEETPERMIYRTEKSETIITIDPMTERIVHKIEKTNDYKIVNFSFKEGAKGNLAELEYIWTGIVFFELALLHGMFALHASAIDYHGRAILFSAPSGTGKSTQAKLWQTAFPEVEIINDDKPLIEPTPKGIFVHGTPWSGKDIQNQNKKIPLHAVVFLSQAKTNQIKTVTKQEEIQTLFKNIYRPSDLDLATRNLELSDQMLSNAFIIHYGCTPDLSAVEGLHKHLFGGN
jgi:hypothetical protein